MSASRSRSLGLAGVLAALACGPSGSGGHGDLALDGLAITGVEPAVVVPGTAMRIDGRSFVDEPWGTAYLELDGTLDGSAVNQVLVPARFVDFDHLEVDVDGETFAALGADRGQFSGSARVVIDSGVDGERYRSEPLAAELEFATTLEPSASDLATPSLTFVNSEVTVTGAGFLLGGNEGQTVAVLDGLFEPEGGELREVGPVEVPLVPVEPYRRDAATFAIDPALTGLSAGYFTGSVALRNDHLAGEQIAGSTLDLEFDMLETTVYGVSPSAVSLGQYMNIEGGGFVGDGATTIKLEGTFTPDGGGDPVALEQLIELVPEFVDGETLRYVVNEDDLPLDLRRDTGTFEGALVPVVEYGGEVLEGSSTQFSIDIESVKQVVYLKFTPGFVEALRHFGLRAAQSKIRERVVEVVQRDYATINLEVRTEKPEDFALYAEVEIGGQDPQGLGLLGYDNTPGKDVGNVRLHDRLGGVNAQTQQDGYPGYGGVFVESLFAFSKNPIRGIDSVPSADPLFDEVFDEFRSDRGGTPLSAADLASGLGDAGRESCPAGERKGRGACAVWVLGNLIGTTLSHEIGHSLGLANPYGSGFHNPFDESNRLMDGGADRPFTERAQLDGDGPGLFCQDEYEYLRNILPTDEPADDRARPGCF